MLQSHAPSCFLSKQQPVQTTQRGHHLKVLPTSQEPVTTSAAPEHTESAFVFTQIVTDAPPFEQSGAAKAFDKAAKLTSRTAVYGLYCFVNACPCNTGARPASFIE
jgi:hypothetical protein